MSLSFAIVTVVEISLPRATSSVSGIDTDEATSEPRAGGSAGGGGDVLGERERRGLELLGGRDACRPRRRRGRRRTAAPARPASCARVGVGLRRRRRPAEARLHGRAGDEHGALARAEAVEERDRTSPTTSACRARRARGLRRSRGRASSGSTQRTIAGSSGFFGVVTARFAFAAAGSTKPAGGVTSSTSSRGSAAMRTGTSPVFSMRSFHGPPPVPGVTESVSGGGGRVDADFVGARARVVVVTTTSDDARTIVPSASEPRVFTRSLSPGASRRARDPGSPS